MTAKPSSSGDSEKIKLIPEVMKWVAQLNQVIITGNLEKGEPGLLEDVRNIRKDLSDMKQRQISYEELEKRVVEIEDRHRRLDADKDKKQQKFDRYTLAMFGVIFTQIVLFILEWFKR